MPVVPIRKCAATFGLITLLLLGACDKQDSGKGQATAQDAATKSAETAYDISRERAGTLFPAANFMAPDDGVQISAPVSLADWRGKPVVLNLWATWCVPCKAEMPTLEKLAQNNAGKFDVIAVSQDIDGAAKVLPYFATAGFKALEPYTDSDNALLNASGGGGLPLTILIDAKGREVLRVTGPLDWSGPEAAVLIAEMVKAGA